MKLILLPFLVFSSIFAQAQNIINHDIEATFEANNQSLKVLNIMTFDETRKIEFVLNKKLKVSFVNQDLKHKVISSKDLYNIHIVESKKGFDKITLNYKGVIDHKISGEFSPGNISTKGVSLLSSTYWYPMMDDTLVTFNLKVNHPKNWTVLSGGTQQEKTSLSATWKSQVPQDDIYLISYPFKEYKNKNSKYDASIYLRNSDDDLAKKYLDFTDYYINMYSDLIGPYPYSKFFVIENYWETGYGMPSFTLLGPSVIRLPFLLYTSFPHEILHNWWGNSVYVDYEKGNWAEGLTTYMADHALQEQRGKGVKSRKDMIKSFMSYVEKGNDFPLRKFKSRHNNATRAIGYNKSAMFFHMLKIQLSEKVFYASLKDFYNKNIFTKASFDDLKKSFESISGRDLSRVFEQWTAKIGQADIQAHGVISSSNEVKFSLTQNSPLLYELYVPVEITLEDNSKINEIVQVNKKAQTFKIKTNKKAKSLVIDPKHDVFRKLLDGESTSTISDSMNNKREFIFIIPSNSSNKEYYKSFAKTLSEKLRANFKIIDDNTNFDTTSKNIWILGKENAQTALIKSAIKDQKVSFLKNELKTQKSTYNLDQFSTYISLTNKEYSLNFLSAPDERRILRLASKITHYGSYSYLVFNDEQNVEKMNWEATNSPFIFNF